MHTTTIASDLTMCEDGAGGNSYRACFADIYMEVKAMIRHWILRGKKYTLSVIVVCALFVLPAETVQAQSSAEASTDAAPALTYGVRIGASITGVRGDNVATEESGMRPTIGVFLSYPLTSWLAVQPEVGYHPHDVKLSSDQRSPAQAWRYTTHYLGVPVLLKGYLPSPGSSELYLLAGPDIAFKLGDNTDLASSEMDELSPAFGDSFNSTDVGAVVGAGLDRYVAGRVFSLDVRYEIGMTDLVTESNGTSLYGRSFSITIGFGL